MVNSMENILDMVKALKCMGSMASSGDCHMDFENFNHLSDKNFKRIVCTSNEHPIDNFTGKEGTRCPYHQDTYGVCMEDGETHWLSETAEFIESIPDMLKKEYSQAIEDFVHELDRTAGYYSGKSKNITREDVLEIAQKLNNGHL